MTAMLSSVVSFIILPASKCCGIVPDAIPGNSVNPTKRSATAKFDEKN